MKEFKKILLLGLMTSWFINPGFSQSDTTKIDDQNPFSYNASYVGEIVTNHSGGIKSGTSYLGLANLKMGFDTRKGKLWRNGFLFINAANTHGGQPSTNLVGDFMGISNIEAGDLTFLFELWYKQTIQNVTIIAGLQDLNASFAVNENGSSFVNSSFGILSSIADNIPAPIFPHSGLGITVQWNIASDYLWQTSLFDGTPDNFETNPYNLNFKLSRNDGMTLISEFKFAKSIIKGMKGSYKLGAYYHEHNHAIVEIKKNYGFYIVADQQISRKSNDSIGLSLFSQIGLCPRDKNRNNNYYSLGATYKGLFNKRPRDEAGIAIAYAGFSRNVVSYETAIEMNYHLKISDNIFIQPDLQYIINPAGTDRKLANAFVSLLRIGVSF